MPRSRISLPALALLLGLAPRTAAAAPADRVVVVVDSAAAGGLDGDAVRRVISGEIRAPVVAPSDPAAPGLATVLIVSVDKATIRMTLRSDAGDVTTRSIAASPDRSARMRDIGWLAGNLLRDQVSTIIGPTHPASSSVPAAPPPPSTTVAEKQGLAMAPAPAAGRSGATGGAAGAAPPDALAARGATAPGSPRAEWDVAVLAGPALNAQNGETPWASTFQLDVQRRAAPRTLVVGGALHIGYAWRRYTTHIFGADAFIGKEWRGQILFAGVAAGLGFEADRPFAGLPSNCPSSPNPCVLNPPDVQTVLFLPLSSTVGVAVTSRVDLAVRLTAQLSAAGLLDTSFNATAGLRLRLP